MRQVRIHLTGMVLDLYWKKNPINFIEDMKTWPEQTEIPYVWMRKLNKVNISVLPKPIH